MPLTPRSLEICKMVLAFDDKQLASFLGRLSEESKTMLDVILEKYDREYMGES